MIYRLRRKFIRICTLSFLAVFVALFLGIYLVTYFQTTSSLDQLADIGSEESSRPAEQDPEAPFTTRFFTVFFDAQGETLSTDVGSIASVTQEEAAGLGKEALEKSGPRG